MSISLAARAMLIAHSLWKTNHRRFLGSRPCLTTKALCSRHVKEASHLLAHEAARPLVSTEFLARIHGWLGGEHPTRRQRVGSGVPVMSSHQVAKDRRSGRRKRKPHICQTRKLNPQTAVLLTQRIFCIRTVSETKHKLFGTIQRRQLMHFPTFR